jgi:hypothetical protein
LVDVHEWGGTHSEKDKCGAVTSLIVSAVGLKGNARVGGRGKAWMTRAQRVSPWSRSTGGTVVGGDSAGP